MSGGRRPPKSFPIHAVLLAFSREFVEEAVKLLITRFIPLNPKDLNAWSTDPEEWMNMEDQENEQWEFELRVSLRSHFFLNLYPLICVIALWRKSTRGLGKSLWILCHPARASYLQYRCW